LTYSSLLDVREKYLEEKKLAEKELAKQKVGEAVTKLDEIISKAEILDGIKIVTAKLEADNMDELKEVGDVLRDKIGNGVGVLFSIQGEKVNIISVVTDNLIKDKGVSAGKIAGDAARILGGGGGGKPHLATAGGKDVSKIDEAMAQVKNIVQKYLK
jgi:alanyl-tRNA synthetase